MGIHIRPSLLLPTPEKVKLFKYKIRLLNIADIAGIVDWQSLELTQEMFEAAIDRGDICIGAFDGNRLVAYVWRAFALARINGELWVAFKKPYRYSYKSFTLPEYRGQHLQDILIHNVDEICYERGYTQGLALVETHNFPALAAQKRRGDKIVGYLIQFKVGNRLLFSWAPGTRKYDICFCRLNQNK